jgi:hypothetical protein
MDVLKSITDEQENKNREIGPWDAYRVTSGLSKFENILAAEFGLAPFYLVSKKRGYDTADLIENAIVLFPQDLPAKVPEAVDDINSAGRCIAFELPTATGFHIHRANESILHRYYDAATAGKTRPSGRNIGDYLAELKKHSAGDPKILSALKDLKDLHRNPLVHPEHSLEDIDEAIALVNAIHGVVVHMLKVIPLPLPPPAP